MGKRAAYCCNLTGLLGVPGIVSRPTSITRRILWGIPQKFSLYFIYPASGADKIKKLQFLSGHKLASYVSANQLLGGSPMIDKVERFQPLGETICLL